MGERDVTPTLVIVGADKGGVGKTLVTRALLDYLKNRDIRFRAVDTEGVLSRFVPLARVVDVETVDGQMEVFDDVRAAGTTVVDMCAGVLSQTLTTMRNAGLLERTDRGDIRLVIMHVLGSSDASMREISSVSSALGGGGEHILIENHVSSDDQFFKWNEEARKSFLSSAKPTAHLVVPHLSGRACETVDRSGVSFVKFIKNEDNGQSDYLSRVVRHWLRTVWVEFDKIKLS